MAIGNEFVYGYHGCSRDVADKVLSGRGANLNSSENDYDWLGSGIYFWEEGPKRALEWAWQKFGFDKAAVIGAKIRLGHCLNLMDVDSYGILRETYLNLVKRGQPLPKNGKLLHRLDCAVINAALRHAEIVERYPYDTVRCPFVEGEPVFPDSKFFDHSHIQISVRTPQAIVEIFPMHFAKEDLTR